MGTQSLAPLRAALAVLDVYLFRLDVERLYLRRVSSVVWKRAHPERVAAITRAYRERNPERVAGYPSKQLQARPIALTCAQCERPFTTRTHQTTARFCTLRCKNAWHSKRRRA